MWQFLSSLPGWFWAGVLGLAGLAIFMLFGSAAAAVLIAILKGGKVKMSKDGLEADAEEHEEKDEAAK